jgi:deoxycytidine triphosphate deaminase
MYVCDQQLRGLLPQLDIRIEDEAEPFNADDQLQPASIDFRLSHIFWKPQRRSTLDLRRSRLLEIQPRRYYRRTQLAAGEAITLRPFELLLGRTLEQFSIPNGYAGDLTGRSSFARLGLMINANGGFINPGWRGHMPLQLVNFSPNPIRLIPGIAICQVRLTKLTELAERPYGHPRLESKYLNDDGGPSYWWRDKRVKRLHSVLAEKLVEEKIQRDIEEVIDSREPEVIERLEAQIGSMRVDDLQSADSVLERFAETEDRRRSLRLWAINVSRASFTVGITVSLWVVNKLPPVRWWYYTVWFAAIVLFGLSAYAFRTEVGDHFGTRELRESRRSLRPRSPDE